MKGLTDEERTYLQVIMDYDPCDGQCENDDVIFNTSEEELIDERLYQRGLVTRMICKTVTHPMITALGQMALEYDRLSRSSYNLEER